MRARSSSGQAAGCDSRPPVGLPAFLAALATAAWLGLPAAGAVPLQGQPYQNPGKFGACATELEDLNGDGRWELLVGAPEMDLGGTDHGRVFLWLGGTGIPLHGDRSGTGQYSEQFGFAVARIGDVNDDGRPDYAVGAPRYSITGANRGRVYVYFGQASPDTIADVIIDSPNVTQEPQFGYSISAAGDFDGDGVDDFVVGAPFSDTGGIDCGAAYVYLGTSNEEDLADADLTLLGTMAYEQFGTSVSDGGNFYRDGNACIVVGAPSWTTAVSRPGVAYVFRGSSSPSPGPDAASDLTLETSSGSFQRSAFGAAVRGVGDWDGDGDDEIAVGAPQDNSGGALAGRVMIYFGGGAPDGTADRYVNGEDGDDLFGYALADVGDVTGSSLVDLLIGAPGQSADGANAGRAYLWPGGGASHEDASALTVVPAQGVQTGSLAGDQFGLAVSAAGDFDGDGERDYAVGAPTGNVANNTTAGYVQLYDSSDTVVRASVQGWNAVWSETGAARLSFRLAEPPASVARLALWREVVPSGADAGDLTLVCDGAPTAGQLPLQVRGETWTLLDRPPELPADASLRYSLLLATLEGGEIRLDGLAGPPPFSAVSRIELRPPQPNPFNPRTVLSFRAPAGQAAACRIVDVRGRLVSTVFEGTATGSWQTVAWDGTSAGRPVPAGIYTVQLAADGQIQSRRVVLAK